MGWNAGDNDRNLFNYKRYLHMFVLSQAELNSVKERQMTVYSHVDVPVVFTLVSPL